jgi:hypothetical protein
MLWVTLRRGISKWMVGALWVWGCHRVWCVAYTVSWSCDSWGRGPIDIESLGLVEALTASCEP